MDVALDKRKQPDVAASNVLPERSEIRGKNSRRRSGTPDFVRTFGDSDKAFTEIQPYFGFCANSNGDRISVSRRRTVPQRNLYGSHGEPIPFAIMDNVFEYISREFPDSDKWETMGVDERFERVRTTLVAAFTAVELPSIEVAPETDDWAPPANFTAGDWSMFIGVGVLTTLPRDEAFRVVIHETQHALQAFFRLSWLAGRYKGPLVAVDEWSGYKGQIIEGNTIVGTDKVWEFAKRHPTINSSYIESLIAALKVDRGYKNRFFQAHTDDDRKELVREWYGDWKRGRKGDPRSSENSAEEAARNTRECERLLLR
jgi:hypothetical protein